MTPTTLHLASITSALTYMSGFGNEFATEAEPGALPVGRNSPQRVPFGLYAEQLSGTAFTAPRSQNRRSWLYRVRPAAVHRAVNRARDRQITLQLDRRKRELDWVDGTADRDRQCEVVALGAVVDAKRNTASVRTRHAL